MLLSQQTANRGKVNYIYTKQLIKESDADGTIESKRGCNGDIIHLGLDSTFYHIIFVKLPLIDESLVGKLRS